MSNRSYLLEKKLVLADTTVAARNLFSDAIRECGYDYFDALSMHAAMLANPTKASRFFVGDYYNGDPWKYLPQGWPADDQLTSFAARSSTPIDYLEYLKTCDNSVSILLQRGMLKTFNVQKAWLFPLNTLGFLRSVTCYMVGKKENQEQIFHDTRDELFILSSLLIDRLEDIYRDKQAVEEATVVVNKMPIALTEIETSVLMFLGKGRSNQEIADMMTISINTVRFHLKKIYKKLGVSSRVEAAAVAIEHGYIKR